MSLFSRLVVLTLPAVPKFVVGRVASRYVAGETRDEAFEVIRALNAEGAMATLDLLGEEVREPAKASAAVEEYIKLFEAIDRWVAHVQITILYLPMFCLVWLGLRSRLLVLGTVTEFGYRRARVELFSVALDRLRELTTPPTSCQTRNANEERRRRRLGSELSALGPELARLGSARVAELVTAISLDLIEGRRHQRQDVIDVALLMAAEIDGELTVHLTGP